MTEWISHVRCPLSFSDALMDFSRADHAFPKSILTVSTQTDLVTSLRHLSSPTRAPDARVSA